MNIRLSRSVLALSLFLSAAPSAWAAGEVDHSQHQQPAASEASHADKMEGKMAKMSVRMEKMQMEIAQAQKKMSDLHTLLEKIQQTQPGMERTNMLAEHGSGLRGFMTSLRDQIKAMMAQMEQKHKKGMDHGGGGSAKKDHAGGSEMMEDMEKHHEVMHKRLELLTNLMDQMEGHLNAASVNK
ncbi:MAG: hypothetical protein HQL93_09640 [Magnetococcales bacterium]|nr:hypothetical protein [Magnetococcales bacterium]